MQELEYVSDAPSELLCAICYHALRDPLCCPRCQKGFCGHCITTWGSTQRRKGVPFSCPYCRASLRFSQLVRHDSLVNRVDALPVRCPLRAQGCEATVPRSEVDAHLAQSCPVAPAQCPDCGATMPRGQLATHISSPACPCRKAPCPNSLLGCRAHVEPSRLAAHLLACAYEPVTCRHCDVVVLRGQEDEHRWAGCPARCPCPNRCFGCDHVAPSLERLATHAPACRYAPNSAYVARFCAALGWADAMYGGLRNHKSHHNHPHHRHYQNGSGMGAFPGFSFGAGPGVVSGGSGGSGGASHHHPLHRHVRVALAAAGGGYGSDLCLNPSLYGSPEPGLGLAGTWCHGLFVPAALYPEGLHGDRQHAAVATDAEGQGAAGGPVGPLPPPAWPWTVDSTREVGHVSTTAAAGGADFTPAASYAALVRQQGESAGQGWPETVAASAAVGLIPEPVRQLLRIIAGEDGEGDDAAEGPEGPPFGLGRSSGGGDVSPGSAAAASRPSQRASRAASLAQVRRSSYLAAQGWAVSVPDPSLVGEGASPAGAAVDAAVGDGASAVRGQGPAAAACKGVAAPAVSGSVSGGAAAAAGGSAGPAGSGGDVVMAEAGPGAAAPVLEMPPPPLRWWEEEDSGAADVATAPGPPQGPQAEPTGAPEGQMVVVDLAMPAAAVYGNLIELFERRSAAAAGPADGGGGNNGDFGGSGGGEGGEFRDLRPGSQDAQLYELYEGQDMTVMDLPSVNTALHHGHRAFWALGLLRLARRRWPGTRLHWRCLAGLNDCVTALARRLLAAVVGVISSELVEESSPMGEGDVMLAVQSLFPAPLAAEALAAVRQTFVLYTDATHESSLWEESWGSLGDKLELSLPLGRVACLVGQYTPLHGNFMDDEGSDFSNDDEDSDEDGDDSQHEEGEDMDPDERGQEGDRDGAAEASSAAEEEGREERGHPGGGASPGGEPSSPHPGAAGEQPAATRQQPQQQQPAGAARDVGENHNGGNAGQGTSDGGVGGNGGGGVATFMGIRAPVIAARGLMGSLRSAMDALGLAHDGARGRAGAGAGAGAGTGGSGGGGGGAGGHRGVGGRRRGVASGRSGHRGAGGGDDDGGGGGDAEVTTRSSRRGSSSSSGAESSGSDGWESADEEEAAELQRQHQQQQQEQSSQRGGGEASGACAGGSASGAPAGSAGPGHWWQRRLNCSAGVIRRWRRRGSGESGNTDSGGTGGMETSEDGGHGEEEAFADDFGDDTDGGRNDAEDSDERTSDETVETGNYDDSDDDDDNDDDDDDDVIGDDDSDDDDDEGGQTEADIRGVVALAAVLEWFAGRTLEMAKIYVESGLMALPSRQLQPWHLQLVLDTSPLGWLLPQAPADTAAATGAAGAASPGQLWVGAPPTRAQQITGATPGPTGGGSASTAGSRLLGSLPLRPLAFSLASLALQPCSALLMLACVPPGPAAPEAGADPQATGQGFAARLGGGGVGGGVSVGGSALWNAAGPAAGAGAGAGGRAAAGGLAAQAAPGGAAASAAAAGQPRLCPLDMRCYCGAAVQTQAAGRLAGPQEQAGAGAGGGEGVCLGPPCSFWSGHQCTACSALSALFSEMPLSRRLDAGAGALRAAYLGATDHLEGVPPGSATPAATSTASASAGGERTPPATVPTTTTTAVPGPGPEGRPVGAGSGGGEGAGPSRPQAAPAQSPFAGGPAAEAAGDSTSRVGQGDDRWAPLAALLREGDPSADGRAPVRPPPDPVAAVTGGAVSGTLLSQLLPPPLRPLLRPAALSHAARMANPGLVSGLLRIHHLQGPSWWQQPSGTAAPPPPQPPPLVVFDSAPPALRPSVADVLESTSGAQQAASAASTSMVTEGPLWSGSPLAPGGGGGAALSAALAEVLRPDPLWLQQLQPHLLDLADVEAVAALSRDLGPALSRDLGPALSRDLSRDLHQRLPGSLAAGDGAPSGAGGETGSGSGSGCGVGGCRVGSPMDVAEGSSERRVGGTGETPSCIPRGAFRALFEECWANVRAERRGGSTAWGPAAAGAEVADSGDAAVCPDQQQHQYRHHHRHATGPASSGSTASGHPSPSTPLGRTLQQPPREAGLSGQGQGQGQGPDSSPLPLLLRQRMEVLPPAMGVTGEAPVRRGHVSIRPTAVLRGMQDEAWVRPAAAGQARAAGAGPQGSGAVMDGLSGGGHPAATALGDEPVQDGGDAGDVGASGVQEWEGDGEGMEWSQDALELLQRAAEDAVMDWLAENREEEGAAGGGGGGGGGGRGTVGLYGGAGLWAVALHGGDSLRGSWQDGGRRL